MTLIQVHIRSWGKVLGSSEPFTEPLAYRLLSQFAASTREYPCEIVLFCMVRLISNGQGCSQLVGVLALNIIPRTLTVLEDSVLEDSVLEDDRRNPYEV